MIVANIFDFIDGKVAHQLQLQSRFGAFWDSTLDRFSDLALLDRLIFLYSKLGRSDYVLIAALALIFSIMTSYARARAESLVEKCKVGFMERPERIVLFMIGAFTNRMAGVLWVILVLSILAVANRIYYTYSRSTACRCRRERAPPASSIARSSGPTNAPRSLRPVGHRDPGVRVAHAARLARRSHGHRPRPHRAYRATSIHNPEVAIQVRRDAPNRRARTGRDTEAGVQTKTSHEPVAHARCPGGSAKRC